MIHSSVASLGRTLKLQPWVMACSLSYFSLFGCLFHTLWLRHAVCQNSSCHIVLKAAVITMCSQACPSSSCMDNLTNRFWWFDSFCSVQHKNSDHFLKLFQSTLVSNEIIAPHFYFYSASWKHWLYIMIDSMRPPEKAKPGSWLQSCS